MISKWKKLLINNAFLAFQKNSNRRTLNENEKDELYKQIGKLHSEIIALKKTY